MTRARLGDEYVPTREGIEEAAQNINVVRPRCTRGL